MSSINIPQGLAPPRPLHAWIRQTMANGLLHASDVLARASVRLTRESATSADPALPVLEYHADAGAPEGALYVDGQLFGWISGTRRL